MGLLGNVKQHLCHYLPAPSRMKRVSRGTGRPVAAFFMPPLTQAVPATSRCAQRASLVKRDKKHAAVMVPASRPPMLAMSAMGLSSCGWYSSHKGSEIGRASCREHV